MEEELNRVPIDQWKKLKAGLKHFWSRWMKNLFFSGSMEEDSTSHVLTTHKTCLKFSSTLGHDITYVGGRKLMEEAEVAYGRSKLMCIQGEECHMQPQQIEERNKENLN